MYRLGLMKYIRPLILLRLCSLFADQSYVLGGIKAELGNNLFQVAAACAVAWDHGAEPYFPELITLPANPQMISLNYYYIFFRCNVANPGPPSIDWYEPDFTYYPIQYHPDMRTAGYFQSEKYFSHHRERILELFAPHPEVIEYVREHYSHILNHPCSVGIQIRDYGTPNDTYAQYGKDYLRKASRFFPKNALYVVSSNKIDFARTAIPEELENIIFIQGESHHVDFCLLSLCKHNIISNSTFGWWGAWLNLNPEKKVIAPQIWFNPSTPLSSLDIIPESWIQIEAKWGPHQDNGWND